MSSFDFTDNFSGFNDLFNRSQFLTEAKRSPYEKYHPSFGPLTKELRSAGFSSAPLDTINFIRTTLYDLELISDDELAAAKKGAGFSAKKNNLLALLDAKADVIEGNKDEIAAAIEDGLAQYINRATTNRGKEEKYAAQKAALELAKDIKAGEDVGDAVEDTVGQLDAAESELADSLQMSKEDPTTFIEIKIRDAERVNDVSEIVTKYANEDGVDISNDTVQFSVDPNTPLANAVSAHGIDKIEAALKRDVDKISDSVVVVMAPDEDYEQIDDEEGEGPSMANYPGGAPGSYAMGEEGGGITEVEDNEEGVPFPPGNAYGGPYSPGHAFTVTKRFQVLDVGGRHSEHSRFVDEFDTVDEVINSIDLPEEYGTEWAEEIKDVSNWSSEGFEDKLRRFGIGEVIEVIDIGSYEDDDLVSSHLDVPKPWPREDEEYDGLELDHFLTKEQPEDYIPSTDYEEVLDKLVKKDKEDHAKRLSGENEEDFNYSPMLDSYKTSTAGYITEQAASDKRNKKAEVKNQSFKEKYKPKTHWQLEELRRYGL
jgi:hypothetical protein